MIKEVKLIPYKQHLMCEECDSGEMHPTGIAKLVYPKAHEHKCDKCETRTYKTSIYPRIVYKEEI